ncbi:MAG: hypothetical protein UW18_C0015G0003 [Microgenomates group bacterium GW2011_GWF1_44_10]|nr:MAG: hypothetical protein UW18_C0015G0003 [Microgenomates group bacterium GW2011_GWF1_44_10]
MNNAQPIDKNGNPILTTDWACSVDKVVTFVSTTNGNGDFNGTGNPETLFNVTGTVLIRILAKCTTGLTSSSGTLEVGTALSTAGLIAQTTASAIDTNEIWHDATPDSSVEATTVLAQKIVSQDVIQTVATADISAGVIRYTAIWYPLSADAEVTAA